jgi:hypothetical protein
VAELLALERAAWSGDAPNPKFISVGAQSNPVPEAAIGPPVRCEHCGGMRKW